MRYKMFHKVLSKTTSNLLFCHQQTHLHIINLFLPISRCGSDMEGGSIQPAGVDYIFPMEKTTLPELRTMWRMEMMRLTQTWIVRDCLLQNSHFECSPMIVNRYQIMENQNL
uniref:FO synthase subunit 2 n=1 Tax=Lygus hesperus TaxID=30085 RepID=A0A0A9XZE5_LYGHE